MKVYLMDLTVKVLPTMKHAVANTILEMLDRICVSVRKIYINNDQAHAQVQP